MARMRSRLLLTREVGQSGTATESRIQYLVGGFTKQFEGVFATPGIAEKGYLDVRIDVTSPGGHSSVPPAHTVREVLPSALLYATEACIDYRIPCCLVGQI